MSTNADNDNNVFRFGRDNLPFNNLSKREVRDYYDRFYGKSEFKYYSDGITRRFLRALLRKAGVPPRAAILDIGCAMGFYSEQFRGMGYNAVGLDISRVGILRGHAKYPPLPLLVGDAAMLPLKQSSFDVFFMLGCSLTNTNDRSALQKYFSYLMDYVRDDGVIIYVGGSDFTGKTAANSEWIYHRYDEILNFVNREFVDADGPYVTDFRLAYLPGKMSLSKFISSAARMLPVRRPWRIVYFIRKKRATG